MLKEWLKRLQEVAAENHLQMKNIPQTDGLYSVLIMSCQPWGPVLAYKEMVPMHESASEVTEVVTGNWKGPGKAL